MHKHLLAAVLIIAAAPASAVDLSRFTSGPSRPHEPGGFAPHTENPLVARLKEEARYRTEPTNCRWIDYDRPAGATAPDSPAHHFHIWGCDPGAR
jgi:hypothetical protein